MIDAAENPFGDYPLDVLMYDGVRDRELDGTAHLDSTSLGFDQEDLIIGLEGHGDFLSDTYSFDTEWRSIVASLGGPAEFTQIVVEDNGQRESSMFSVSSDQNFALSASPAMSAGSRAFRVSDPENWGWAIAVASSNAVYRLPGEDIPEGSCPPGCPPLP